MSKRKHRFWQWLGTDGASLAGSWISNAVGAVAGGTLGTLASGVPGGIGFALLGALTGHYFQKKLSATAKHKLQPYEVLEESKQKSEKLEQKLEDLARKNREKFYAKQQIQEKPSPVEEYAVVYEGYNADSGFHQFKRLDNGEFVLAQVKNFSGGIGIDDTLIFRRQRGSSWAVVELLH